MPDGNSIRKSGFTEAFPRLQPRSIRKFGSGDLLAAFEFDVCDLKCGCRSASCVDISGLKENLTRDGIGHMFRRRTPGKMAELPAKFGIGSRPRSEGTHAVINFLSWSLPVNESIFPVEHGREGGGRVVLWLRSDAAGAETPQSVEHQVRTSGGKAGGEFGRCLIRTDRKLLTKQHFAGVHARVDAHGGIASDGFALRDGPVDGSCATISGEQGSMEIDPAEPRYIEKARWNNLSVSDD